MAPTPIHSHTDTRTALELVSDRARMRRDGETFTDWIIRLADYYLGTEDDGERARRLR